jgi:hypothetical protein
MCFTLGASIAEIVSAFPTCGGLYVMSFFSSLHTTDINLPMQVHRLRSTCPQEMECSGR